MTTIEKQLRRVAHEQWPWIVVGVAVAAGGVAAWLWPSRRVGRDTWTDEEERAWADMTSEPPFGFPDTVDTLESFDPLEDLDQSIAARVLAALEPVEETLQVAVIDGRASIYGSVPANRVAELVDRIAAIEGVREVVNYLSCVEDDEEETAPLAP